MITDIRDPALDVYSRTPEVQLLRLFEPNPGIFIAESPKVVQRALDGGYEPISILAEKGKMEGEADEVIKRCGDIPVYMAEPDVLTGLTGFKLTRGLLCAMKRKSLPSVSEICAGARRIAVLENVVNPTNVGAVFRSAAALNMDAVLPAAATLCTAVRPESAWERYFRFPGQNLMRKKSHGQKEGWNF